MSHKSGRAAGAKGAKKPDEKHEDALQAVVSTALAIHDVATWQLTMMDVD